MAKIVEPPKGKRVTRNACAAVIEYMPEESETHNGTKRVKCPRPGCSGYGYIRTW